MLVDRVIATPRELSFYPWLQTHWRESGERQVWEVLMVRKSKCMVGLRLSIVFANPPPSVHGGAIRRGDCCLRLDHNTDIDDVGSIYENMWRSSHPSAHLSP
jgi:hypothetical protein